MVTTNKQLQQKYHEYLKALHKSPNQTVSVTKADLLGSLIDIQSMLTVAIENVSWCGGNWQFDDQCFRCVKSARNMTNDLLEELGDDDATD